MAVDVMDIAVGGREIFSTADTREIDYVRIDLLQQPPASPRGSASHTGTHARRNKLRPTTSCPTSKPARMDWESLYDTTAQREDALRALLVDHAHDHRDVQALRARCVGCTGTGTGAHARACVRVGTRACTRKPRASLRTCMNPHTHPDPH